MRFSIQKAESGSYHALPQGGGHDFEPMVVANRASVWPGAVPVPAQSDAIGEAEAPKKGTWLQRDCNGLVQLLKQRLNLLIIFVPFGLASAPLKWESVTVFFINFLAIIPLANIIHCTLEAVAASAGPRIGGLVDAFLGKVVEQVMCVQCMRLGLVKVLQGNMMGSLHWCLLLILGMAIFSAGVSQNEISFSNHGASAQMSCQVVASISVALPTMYRTVSGSTEAGILYISRIAAFTIMMVYFLFLFFHLQTHAALFDDNAKDLEGGKNPSSQVAAVQSSLSLPTAITLMIGSICLVSMCSYELIGCIEDVSNNFGVPKAFIGCTLLPMVGNTAEHITAVTWAMKGNMDLAISIAVGSATQIALFVIPGAVLWGWWFDEPMSLNFRNFDATVMILTTFLTSQVLQHGNTQWLHGAMLMTTYMLIAIISWFLPEVG